MERFKRRADLINYTQRHPGALTAHFLNAVRTKLLKGSITESKQLREVPVSDFIALGHTGLTEVRDLREAQTIAACMDAVNRRDLSKCLDVFSMRLIALT